MKPGDILASKYQLVQRIGEGAMGEVWSGENQATGGKVALKLIIPSAPEHRTPDLRQRLLREAKACGKLSHRNIVQIHDAGETPDGDPFLVLELLHGKTLAEQLKDIRRIEPAMAARIGAEIAEALAVAHAAKIIHRDLKPANIFLHREEGVPEDRFIVKVLDFGVSKNMDGGSDGPATNTNVAVGSPAYMSPEQIAMRKDLDGRTDIWSLGIVLYEMLTGARPFAGNVDEVVRQVVLTKVNKIPLPSSKIRGVPPEFDEIVGRCLESNRDRRYANAAEISSLLHAFAQASRSVRPPLSSSAYLTNVSERAGASVIGEPAAPITAPIPARDGGGTEPMPGRTSSKPNAEQASSKPPPQGSAGTAVMSPNEPVASPGPGWRKEMQQWRSLRESSAGTLPLGAQDATPGNTQALASTTDTPVEEGPGQTATTSTIGALSQPAFVPPLVAVPAPSLSGTTLKRKRNSRALFAMMGIGVLSALAVVVLMLNASHIHDEQAVGTESVAPQAASATLPLVLVQPASEQPSPAAAEVVGAKNRAPEPAVMSSSAAPAPASTPSASESVVAASTAVRGASTTTLGKSGAPLASRAIVDEPVAPQVKGFANIICNPSCDEVIVDGRSLGPSPVVRAELLVGLRNVRLKRKNQPDKHMQISVETGRTASLNVN